MLGFVTETGCVIKRSLVMEEWLEVCNRTAQTVVMADAAGADVLYAPGLSSTEQIQTLKESVTKPINVLVAFMPDLTFRLDQGILILLISTDLTKYLSLLLTHIYGNEQKKSANF